MFFCFIFWARWKFETGPSCRLSDLADLKNSIDYNLYNQCWFWRKIFFITIRQPHHLKFVERIFDIIIFKEKTNPIQQPTNEPNMITAVCTGEISNYSSGWSKLAAIRRHNLAMIETSKFSTIACTTTTQKPWLYFV